MPRIGGSVAPVESPLAAFVDTITLMGRNRRLLAGIIPRPPMTEQTDFEKTLEDVALLLDDNCVIGLRTIWARRVAAPIVLAQRCLNDTALDAQDRAKRAVILLDQCIADPLRSVCQNYIRDAYNVGG